MMRFTFLLLIILSVLLLSGCGNKAAEACKNFTTAVEKQDYAGAKEFATESSQDLLNQAQFYWNSLSIADKEDFPRKSYNILSTSIKGDIATVTLDEIDAGDRSRKVTRELKMEKEDGAWKVQLDAASESILTGGEE